MTAANAAADAAAADALLAQAAGNPAKRKRGAEINTKRAKPRYPATANALPAAGSSTPVGRDFAYPVIDRLHHMPLVCGDEVLPEMREDTDAGEKTNRVLADVFWREYEMAEVGRVVSGVATARSIEVVGDLEVMAGVLAGDGEARKRKREDDPGEYSINTRVRKEMDLPCYANRGSLAKKKKQKRRGPVKFPGFQRPEELTWEDVVAAGGVPGRVGGVGSGGGAVVEAGTVGDVNTVGNVAPVGVRAAGRGLLKKIFRIAKGRGGEADNLGRRGGTVAGGGTGAWVGGAKCPSPKSGNGSGSGSGGGRRELRSGRGWPNGRGVPKREIGDGHADNLVEYMFRRTGTRFRVPEPAPTVSSYLLIIYNIF